jgi:hypothetical protein
LPQSDGLAHRTTLDVGAFTDWLLTDADLIPRGHTEHFATRVLHQKLCFVVGVLFVEIASREFRFRSGIDFRHEMGSTLLADTHRLLPHRCGLDPPRP